MAIKIQTEKTEIPVEIGNLKFSFDVSDESIKKFRREALEVQKEFHSISVSKNDDEALEQAKGALKRGFDFMLGEGAFEKIYDLSPSVIACMNYFVQLQEGIEQELKERGYPQNKIEKAKKYIRNKK